jgi:threonylcarbamoyladenosine tRNA methylthiotransferase MtaB
MFHRTLDLVEACGLTHLHVFPFSPREGTPAARMPQTPRDIAKQRATRLREAGATALSKHLERRVGERVEALSERGGVSRARDFTLVRTPGVAAGRLFSVEIDSHDGAALIAKSSGEML